MVTSTAIPYATPWADLSPDWQSRLRQALPEHPVVWPSLACPGSRTQLVDLLTQAHGDRLTLVPCGAGTKLSWGNPAARAELAVSTSQLTALIDHAVGDLTITAEAGMSLAQLQAQLAQHQQFLPLDPPSTDHCTLGGAIATADSGPLRQGYGGVRDLLIGIEFVRHDGQIAKAGGRVVKNVAGYDLMKLFTGSFGSLGILSQVTFRVYPLPECWGSIAVQGSHELLDSAAQALQRSALTPVAMEWVSAAAMERLGYAPSLTLLLRFGSVAASVTQQLDAAHQMAQSLQLQTQRFTEEAVEQGLWHAYTRLASIPREETGGQPWTQLGSQPEPQPGPQLKPQLEPQLESQPFSDAEGCRVKLGVKPTAIASLLGMLDDLAPDHLTCLRAGSGVGWAEFSEVPSPATVMRLRQHCQNHGGYLTLLSAPAALKRTVDVWGYGGNAIAPMAAIKTQFDPLHRLNPGRFIV